MAKQIENKHPLAVRWLHWINFPLLAMMIWSGLLIYWANPVYGIRIFGYELFRFFPPWFYDVLGIPYRLAEGLQLHFFFMWLFAVNGFVYVVYVILSGEWRSLLPVPGSFRRAAVVALHDAHIVKSKPAQGKYNDAQRLAYTSVIVMGAGSALTGLAIYKPLQLAWLTGLFGGYEWARWIHFWLTIGFVLFFAVHVVQVALAGWSNFRSMITGREIVDADNDATEILPAGGGELMSIDDKEVLLEKVRGFEKANDERLANTAEVLNEKRRLSKPMTEAEAKKLMRQHSRRSFLVTGVAALAGIFGWRWMPAETRAALLRRTFEFNERVSQIFYRPTRLAPEFPPETVTAERTNGLAGLETEIDIDAWRLVVGGLANRTDDLILTLDEIKALPRTEMTTELKCIEGWSIVVHWAGVRFSDFAAKYPPKTHNGTMPDVKQRPQDLVPYVSITTPDEKYYVGWDMPSILHPQTLLAYEMNGAPLTSEHGAPLRIASPTKYGIKQIKRIGRIEFTTERPRIFGPSRKMVVMTGTPDTELVFINEGFIAESVTAPAFDELLAAGWRHFGIHFQRYSLNLYDGEIRRVIPLRIRLSDFRFSKSHRRILRQNADLETGVGPIEITADTHELFAWHKRRFRADVPPSIYTFLSDDPARVPTEGLEVSVRSQGQLLAASFFDVGVTSISSVYGIFLPYEASRSLGIFTMLKEIEFALEHGKEFYYHGYAYEGSSYYDYKKRFPALEAFDWQGEWHPFLDA